MKAEIKRTYGEIQTTGQLTVFDDQGVNIFTCCTLELPWRENKRRISCIPEGDYIVVKRPATEKRKYNHFHITEVPGRDWILIHIGNSYKHILGCILVGDEFKDIDKDGNIDVINSTHTLKILYALLPEKFKLTVM